MGAAVYRLIPGGLFAASSPRMPEERQARWRKGCGARARWYLMEYFRAGSSTRFSLDYAGLGLHAVDARHPTGLVIGAYGLGGLLAGFNPAFCAEGAPCAAAPSLRFGSAGFQPLGGSLTGIFLVVAFGVFPLSFAPSGQGGLMGILGAGQP